MTSSSNAKFLCLRCFNCASPREALLYTVTGCLSYAAATATAMAMAMLKMDENLAQVCIFLKILAGE